MTPEHLSGRRSVLEVLRAPSVGAYISANVLLYVGLSLQVTTLAKQVYDITRRELDLGFLGLAEFLPIALLVFVTGTVADRFNRKRISQIAMAGELASALLLMWYASTKPTSVFPIFVIAVLYGSSRAFLAPSMRPIAAAIAPEGRLPQMIALYSTVWTSAGIVGPAMSGFLYSASPVIAYGTGSALILIALATFSAVRVPATQRGADANERPTLRSAVEGLRYIRRTPILFAAIALDLFAVLFGGAVALLPVIAEERLGVGNIAYGWLRAAAGIGAGAVALLLAIRPLRRNVGRWLLVAVAVFGVGTIVLGLTRTYWIAFVAVLVIHGADMVSVFVRGSIVPLVTPDDKRGRVSAVENVFIGATNELGAFESGVAAQAVGVPATVVGGGVLTLGIVGVWWVKFKQLRDVDRFEDLKPA
ncbi:MAG: MFS transporter [Actinobacteria bacterium]|nr:MFS transporter [Actinomycetota bacterium]